MPLNPEIMGKQIAKAIYDIDGAGGQGAEPAEIWQAVSRAIINHFVTESEVIVSSGSTGKIL